MWCGVVWCGVVMGVWGWVICDRVVVCEYKNQMRLVYGVSVMPLISVGRGIQNPPSSQTNDLKYAKLAAT